MAVCWSNAPCPTASGQTQLLALSRVFALLVSGHLFSLFEVGLC